MRARPWLAAITGLTLAASLLPSPLYAATAPVQVILDGTRLSLNPAPFIQNDRTLVPLRGVIEAMGAVPVWNGEARTVEVTRGDRYVRLTIDKREACLDLACTQTTLLDVPATIVQDRTFVPVRFIATALGVDVSWDENQRAVLIQTENANPSGIHVEGVAANQVITGPISLKASGASGSQVTFYLVDPVTRKGRPVAGGSDVSASYTYTPEPSLVGARQIVAGVKDSSGTIRYSNLVPVTVVPDTRISVTGVAPGGMVTGPVTFGHTINFVPTYIVYRLIDPATGQDWDLATAGAGDPFTWYPAISSNGPKQIQVLAYDLNGTEYRSEPVPFVVNSDYRTVFSSIKEGESLTGRARTLSVSANYDIRAVRFLLDGKLLSTEKSYWWTFGPADNGTHSLTVEVTDTAGTVRTVGPISFRINSQPGLWLYGVGPKQVVTEAISLMAMPNIPADTIKFFLREGGKDTLIGEKAPGQSLSWTPASSGPKVIYAQAFKSGQWVASTEPINFQVYLSPTYPARPIVEKSQFKDFISAMAVKARTETGMSAALQVAQAILETGWGQYVPVDKYTGQFSNNLFGIKGSGSAGSIISTTWEVYNGERYTVDDYFRAYNSAEESLRDHNDLLLTKSWYAPFRAVMADPIQGAWGLRRSGYATDPQYPVKLINIMKQQDLFRLDEVQF